MRFDESSRRLLALLCVAALVQSPLAAWQQDELNTDHSDCVYFGAKHKKYADTGWQAENRKVAVETVTGTLTTKVTARLASGAVYADGVIPDNLASLGTIDRNLFSAMRDTGVTPAEKTNDFEFARRVSLDLTGRAPTARRLIEFVNDADPDKRARFVDELLAKPEWVDKWTMYFGDLFKNNARNTQVVRFADGRDAFYKWIKESLAANKPYDKMARELISARGDNSYRQGELNFLIGSFVTGGPQQDIWDQQAADTAETFLGLGNMTCLLCHNGRGHLDALSLWGKGVARTQAWQMAAFFSQAFPVRTPVDPANRNVYYWSYAADARRYPGVYNLNTTTGNRPPRQPIGTMRSVTPEYMFSGVAPKQGENYQEVLAREMTGDFQFARAAVNYLWKEFFGLGLVEPANQFDLARLDPDNPPPAPWKLQPANARLLNELARDFIDMGYDVKRFMRVMTTSEVYQLSSRYDPAKWTISMEPLFARHFVRRLWAEEVHDNLAQMSNILPTYRGVSGTTTNWAMQLPEPRGLPGGTVTAFLDSFQRGNRDDEDRGREVTSLQALNLMNDPFVMTRIKASGAGERASLLAQNLNRADDQLVTNLYLTVLSRHPTRDELNWATARLRSAPNRTQAAEDLLWSLYNKVDFLFNY